MPKQIRPIIGNKVKSGRRAAAQKARERIQTQEKEERLSIDRLTDLYAQQDQDDDDSPDDSPPPERHTVSRVSDPHPPASVRDERYSSIPQRRSIVASSLHERDNRYSVNSYRSIVPPTLVHQPGPRGVAERKIQLGGGAPRTVIGPTLVERDEGRHPVAGSRGLGGAGVGAEREDRLARYIVAPPNRREESHQSSSRPDSYSSTMSREKRGEKTEDLKNMLMSFRIAELQTLLATCGRSRTGRKHELLGRAVSLLKSSEGSSMRERVKNRILELYHQRYIPGGMGDAGDGVEVGPPSSNGAPVGSLGMPVSYVSPSPYMFNGKDKEPPPYINPSPYHKYEPAVPPTYILPQGMTHQHDPRAVYKAPAIMPPASTMPVHPDVRFINLPFYDIVDVLIKPTSLVQKTLNGIQDTNLVYHFTPYQTQLIINSRLYHIKSSMEYAVQVQLRFCLAETSCVQEDVYPSRCRLIVNGKGCTLPGQPPPNAQNQEPRKPHRPVNITQLCRLSAMQSNQIQIQWMPSELGHRHVATVHLVKIVQSETLIQQLSNKPIRSKAHSIGFIKEKLRPDPDSEIAMTSLKVSLCCPIGMTRMNMPCRGKNCNHLQCFDGALYIQMNERKPSWVCPVCDQKAYYNDLFKDGLFLSIIEEEKNCDEIVFFEDGSWKPLADVQQTNPSRGGDRSDTSSRGSVVDCPTSPSTPRPATNADDSDASPAPAGGESESNSNSNGNTNNENGKDKPADDDNPEVIILDDSDTEDSPPPERAPDSSASQTTEVVEPRFTSPMPPSEPPRLGDPPMVLPYPAPELQNFDLYNIPREDRIAATAYLNQHALLSTQVAATTGRSAGIIDISDME